EIKEKERELTANMEKLNRAFSQTVEVLAQTVESRDPYTAGHQRRTALLSDAIAERMGLDDESRRGLYLAAAIHDVGKISVPAEILSKPGALQPVEMNLVKTHSEEGYIILKKADFPWRLAKIVRQHHERLDGSGYPLGLKGDEILPEAKILAVADVVEAMASHRPYRPSLGAEAALSFVEESSGNLFDPLVVKACRDVFKDGFDFGGDAGL
ncbi:MAG: HD-GYP domain-containing protein, partial [Synergistaceae bacterium]|nr:HD-GYP domain-containing protein [Synergistaceae bacterium]